MKISRQDYKYLLDKAGGFSKAKQIGKKVNLKKILDDDWSRRVKELAGNICEKCGKSKCLNSHHIISRRHNSIRHDLSNGVCLCAGCHFFAHQSSGQFHEWIISKRGQEWFDRLQVLKNTIRKG